MPYTYTIYHIPYTVYHTTPHQEFVKTRRRTTQTRKGTAILIFSEHFIYFTIFFINLITL